MAKSKLIGILHLYAKKQAKGYQPCIENIIVEKPPVLFKKIFKTQEECVAYLERNLEEIKKENF